MPKEVNSPEWFDDFIQTRLNDASDWIKSLRFDLEHGLDPTTCIRALRSSITTVERTIQAKRNGSF